MELQDIRVAEVLNNAAEVREPPQPIDFTNYALFELRGRTG